MLVEVSIFLLFFCFLSILVTEGTLELAMDEVERLLQSTSSNALASSMDVRKMGEGSLRPVLRQRPDGTFERVVTLDHAPAPAPTAVATTVSESSIINTSSVSKEEATQAADIVVPKVGAEKNGISVEKSVSGASSLRSLNNSNSAASSGGAGDFELLDVDTGIDENAAISKQAVQAIRRLHKEGRYSKLYVEIHFYIHFVWHVAFAYKYLCCSAFYI